MNKKDILLSYYHKIRNLWVNLEEEMGGFLIESLAFIHVITPIIEYFSENNDIVLKEIFSQGNISLMIVEKNRLKKFLKTISWLKYEENSDKISEVCDSIYLDLIMYIHDDKKESLISSFSDYFEWIDKNYVREFFEKNSSGKYHELLNYLQEEQEKKNVAPCIKKADFLAKYLEFNLLIDKDWLVNISGVDLEIGEYGIYYKDFFIYYNNIYSEVWIRRDFLDEFLSFRDKSVWKNIEIRILLDFDRIISRNDYKRPILFGACFFWVEFKLEHFFTTSNQTLFTRKQRVNPKFDSYNGNRLIYTDFYIDQINNSFLIEEIWENLFRDFFMNRLIHSEFDVETKKIKHFDGSILLYEQDALEIRKSKLLSSRPKLSKTKQKLFRIDGEIDFESYRDILLKFFSGNELILEYFDINEYKRSYKDILDYENGIDY